MMNEVTKIPFTSHMNLSQRPLVCKKSGREKKWNLRWTTTCNPNTYFFSTSDRYIGEFHQFFPAKIGGGGKEGEGHYNIVPGTQANDEHPLKRTRKKKILIVCKKQAFGRSHWWSEAPTDRPSKSKARSKNCRTFPKNDPQQKEMRRNK